MSDVTPPREPSPRREDPKPPATTQRPPIDPKDTPDPRPTDWREALRGRRRDDAVAVFVALVATAALVLGVMVFDQLIGGLFR